MQFPRVLLTLSECTLLTGISRSELYRGIESGELVSRSIRGRRRVHTSDLEKYIGEALPSQQTATGAVSR